MVIPTLSGYILLKHITNVQLSNYDKDVATQGWAPQARDVQPPIFETGPGVKTNSLDYNQMKCSCCLCSCCPWCHFSVWPQGGASSTKEILCNTKTLPRVFSERADRRLVACVYNVEQEDSVCGKPSGVCYHHTEWEDTERMPQFVCGQRKR